MRPRNDQLRSLRKSKVLTNASCVYAEERTHPLLNKSLNFAITLLRYCRDVIKSRTSELYYIGCCRKYCNIPHIQNISQIIYDNQALRDESTLASLYH